MESFRLLKRTRQVTEYSCGASALQSVLSYWGRDIDEQELMKLMYTSFEEGTYPEDMVRGAQALGFTAEARENLTVDDLRKFTEKGDPAIALGQFWRSASGSPKDVAEGWDSGHWVVVLGVDDDYVYFQDPFMRMSKAFVPRKGFEDHWHQVMGGDLKKNKKLIHLGIFVRGEKPVDRVVAEASDLSSLNFSNNGSLNLIVTQFEGFLLPFDFLDDLREIWNDKNIRPDAFIFLRKDKDGNVAGMEGNGLHDDEDEDAMDINVVLAVLADHSIGSPQGAGSRVQTAIKAAAAGDFGLSSDDIREIASRLPPDHSAIIAVFENVWERRLREVAKKYGGTVINQRLVSTQALVKAASDLAASARSTTA
jgi:predicted double-glycine peptidase